MSEVRLKIATYSETGGRKTLQIGHLIDAFGHENVGIISCEDGLSTIASLVNWDYVKRVTNVSELREAYVWAKQNFTRPEQWVCIDGGSRALQWYRDEVVANVNTVFGELTNGVKRKDLPDYLRQYAMFVTKELEINTMSMWYRVSSNIERLLNGFVGLPSSSYWTFWEELSNLDQYTKAPPYKPDTPGKGAFDAVKGSFDFICRLVPSTNNCKAIFLNGSGQYAKRRDDWRGGIRVEDIIDPFNLAEFVQTVRGA